MQFELLKSLVREGPLTVVVNGDCMRRTIPAGSDLRLESRRVYWPGDAVAFKRGDGSIVCHRLLGYFPTRNGWRVLTRADNARQADMPVFASYVLGKVTRVGAETFGACFKDRARAWLDYFPAMLRQLARRFGTAT